MGYVVLHLEKAKGTDSRMSAHIERTVHPKNAHAPEPGIGAILRRGEEPYAGDSAPDRDGRHQTQGGHQPGEGNPGTAHRKQQGHEANGSGRAA